MSDKVRTTPGKMQLFLMSEGEGTTLLASSDPGDISDKTLREMVDHQGNGSYKVITGRIRDVSLASRTVTEFKIGG
jgi:hypothetical protein